MIDPDLDVGRWREALAARGRTQIEAFLQPDAAEHLHACLAHDVPWTLAYKDGPEPAVLPHEQWSALDDAAQAAVLARCHAHARTGYAFAYESYMMVRAYKEGRDPDLLLHRVLEFLNSPDFIAFARVLTRNTSIRRANAQATRYRAGHFLTQHNDFHAGEGRQLAYVLNLTREWHADHGGLLQFMDDSGRVVETLLPRWNTLSLFHVPAHHCVTLVAPWAREPRLAITGWLLT